MPRIEEPFPETELGNRVPLRPAYEDSLMMKSLRFGLAMSALGAAAMLSGCAEQAARTSRIAPSADESLRGMCTALSGAKTFSFRSTATMDELLSTGQLVEFSRETRIVVRRPDRLFAEIRQGQDIWLVWYADRNLTILDKRAGACASVQVPGRIDDMLDELAEKYDLAVPLADLLFAEPYKVLTAEVLTGQCVGVHEASGEECTHLLFTQDNVDWQIWITKGRPPLPRKVLIDYKNLAGRPQFAASLTDWDLSPAVGDDQFTPMLPKDVRTVDMARILEPAQRTE